MLGTSPSMTAECVADVGNLLKQKRFLPLNVVFGVNRSPDGGEGRQPFHTTNAKRPPQSPGRA